MRGLKSGIRSSVFSGTVSWGAALPDGAQASDSRRTGNADRAALRTPLLSAKLAKTPHIPIGLCRQSVGRSTASSPFGMRDQVASGGQDAGLLHDDLRRGAARRGASTRGLLPDAVGDGEVGLGVGASGVADHERRPAGGGLRTE